MAEISGCGNEMRISRFTKGNRQQETDHISLMKKYRAYAATPHIEGKMRYATLSPPYWRDPLKIGLCL